jgi:hypothetical protein
VSSWTSITPEATREIGLVVLSDDPPRTATVDEVVAFYGVIAASITRPEDAASFSRREHR